MVLTTTMLDDTQATIQSFIISDWTHFCVGDGTTTPAASDTALDNQTFIDTIDDTDTSVSNEATVTGIVEAGENNGNDINEVGIKDGATGNLKCRKTITTITKTSDIIVYIDYTVTITMEEI
ncbi:MAG: hypothetical protein D6706_19270 [Chloroflexi bacterium]|nr:MAG: hypothetical protein D6706_19270 [Chloroflexota bacterium]